MKLNKISLIFLASLLFSLAFISGAMTVVIDSPSASSTVSGTTVNVSITATNPGRDWNCTIYAKSSLTANSSWSTLGGGATIKNATATIWNVTINSIVLEDANNYIFNATCINATLSADDTNTGITVDNTIPQASTGLTPTSDTDDSVIFSGTVVGANTTSCTLLFDGINPGSSSYAMTHSGNTCTHTLTVPKQTYRWYIRASDETNTTDSSTQTTNVDISSGAGRTAYLAQQAGIKSEGGATFSIVDGIGDIPSGWIVAVIVIVIVLVIILVKKKS